MPEFSRNIRTRAASAAMIVLLAAVSALAMNQYRFGVWDHTVILPLLRAGIEQGAYAGDYLLSAYGGYHTLFWPFLAAAVRTAGVSLPGLFFWLYAAALLATLGGVYALGMTIFPDRRSALLGCFLFLFSKHLPGGDFSLDEILYTRTAAFPFLVYGLALFLRDRPMPAGFLFGIGFLVHPLSAFGFIAAAGAAALAAPGEAPRGRLLLGGLLVLALASPLLCRWLSRGAFSIPEGWLEVVRLRSPGHVFPFSWSREEFFRLLLVLAIFPLAWPERPATDRDRKVRAFLGAAAVLGLAGVVFTEFFPIRAAVQLQFFRVFKPVYLLALLYLAGFFVRSLDRTGGRLRETVVPALGALALLYGANYWREGTVLLMGAAFLLVRVKKPVPFPAWAGAVAAAALLLGLYAYAREGWDFSVAAAQPPHWQAVQSWAREKSEPGAVFIVPPTWSHEGFRLGADRVIYGDWKDGTMAAWSPEFGIEWLRRMRRLGLKNPGDLERDFRGLREKDFLEISAEPWAGRNPVYLVHFADAPTLGFPPVYRNNRYLVYRIR